MRLFLLTAFLGSSLIVWSQTLPEPFELRNQNGKFFLVSIPPSDKAKALTVVFSKKDTTEQYRFPLFLDEFAGLSQDGQKIVNYLSDPPFQTKSGNPTDSSAAAFFLQGKIKGLFPLGPIISNRLNELPITKGKRQGWVEKDSVIHKMALNPFYIDEDRVFISTGPMKLNAYDINSRNLLYCGPGRSHFTENYYSIPLQPYREELKTEALQKILSKTQD
jgi:hypothetical protein